jgi:signal transduction histidine kinase
VTERVPDESALAHADEEERLRIARELRRHPRLEAAAPLKAALAREHVRWVRVALQEAIYECEGAANASGSTSARSADDETEASEDIRQAYADGRRDGLRQALHEIAPLLGLARVAAESDLDEQSHVRTQLERMRAVTGALRELVSASAVPERRDFDLAELLTALRLSPPVPCPDGVIGTRGDYSPFVISGDRDLLELAVRPLLTNAIEAVLSVAPAPPARSVMLSYGTEQAAYYIAIIDAGPGLAAGAEPLAPGVSTKKGHFGLGLETAQTAIESLGGSLALEANRQGGATAILRWPRPS